MNNQYPKPRWDLENDIIRFEEMIIVSEQEIKQLEEDKAALKEEIIFLREQLEYKTNGLPNTDINTTE